jgi:outer membrane receptor protein involved in Fe transport
MGKSEHRQVGRGSGVLVLVATLSIMLISLNLWAQSTAAVQGTVTGPNGQALAGVAVRVVGEQRTAGTVTDNNGFYSIPDLPPGNYQLTALLDPFAVGEEEFELGSGQTLTLDLALESLAFGAEIEVTAQKRAETLLEIPASITVLTSDTIERQRVENLLDLEPLVPGLDVVVTTPGQSRITLRGINTGGVGSTVGVYLGEVPFGSSTGLANGAVLAGDFDTFDMATVEVLRGPQGTLYGASSLGGVLRFVPNRPTTEQVEARFLGSLETVTDGDLGYSLKGLVNVPLSDSFALRASGFYRYDDGFIDSIGNNPVPSLTTPGVDIIDGTMVAENINTADTYGGRIAALWEPSEKFSLLLAAQTQTIESGAPNLIDADPVTLEPLFGLVQSRYFDQTVDTDYQVFDATIDWDFGPASLVSITSFGSIDQDILIDATTNTALTGGLYLASFVTFALGDDVERPLSAVLPQNTATDKITQELRLVSSDNEKFEWLVGGYYTDEDSQIIQEIVAIEGDTGETAEDIPLLADATILSTYEEFALFGNATWYISSRFDLAFGARQSWNDQVASQVLDGLLIGGRIEFDDATSSENPFTYSISPRYSVTDTSSIYGRIATGFRPGGPNVLPPGTPPGVPGSYDSDTLTSYEVGWKSTGPSGKYALDLAVYYLDWQDIQLFIQVEGIGINGNGGTAVSKGGELAFSVFPTDGLTLTLNGAYIDAYLTEDTDPIVGGLDGDPLPYIPETSGGFTADYEWTVGRDSLFFVGGSIAYVGDRAYSYEDRDDNGEPSRIDSYTTLDLRAGLYSGRWSLELYGRNLTNEMGIVSVTTEGVLPNGAYGLAIIRPRTVGLSVGVRFWGS